MEARRARIGRRGTCGHRGRAMKRVIEITSNANTREEAEQCLDQGQRIMVGFLGGRILPPSRKHSAFVVQTFHKDCDLDAPMSGWLPDGMRRCYLPHAVARQCGIECNMGFVGQRFDLDEGID